MPSLSLLASHGISQLTATAKSASRYFKRYIIKEATHIAG